MCHPEVPEGMPVPVVEQREIEVELGTGEKIPAMLAEPEGAEGMPVLVVSDIFGRSSFYEVIAARLASAGLRALLPDYFFRLEPLREQTREAAIDRRTRLNENRTLEDLRQCIAWLRSTPGYKGKVGTVGFCMGGTLALDLAAAEAGLVTVCYYGFPAPPPTRTPFTPPAPLEQVQEIRGPVLAFWGDQDSAVGLGNVEAFAKAMNDAGKDFQHKVYPGLGHGFLSASGLEQGSPGYAESCESWTLAIDFWRRHLTPAGVAA